MFRMAATVALWTVGSAVQAGLSKPSGSGESVPGAATVCFATCGQSDQYAIAGSAVFESVQIDAPITLMLLGVGLLLLRHRLRRSGLAI
jgi:hypothetical protein